MSQSNSNLTAHINPTPQEHQKAIKQNPWLGVTWKILAFACFAALNAIVRFLSGGADSSLESNLPVNVIIFSQDLIAFMIVSPWLLKSTSLWQKPKFVWMHLFRVVISAIAVITWYFAIHFLPLADAVALSIIGPLLGVVGANLYLKEKMSEIRLIVLLSTFIAAFLLVKPYVVILNNADNVYGLVCVFVSALCFALAKIATRRLASLGESRKLLTSYSLVLIVPVTLIPALFVWVTPQAEHIIWLLMAGGLTVVGLYAVSSALAYAEISFLAPFDCFRFMLNAGIGYIAFMELPPTWAIWLMVVALLLTITSFKYRAR